MDLSQFGLRPLTLSDKPYIDNVLKTVDSGLSSYAFTSHYIWSDIFKFYWGIFDDFFCLFATYGDYIYMPLPPVLFVKRSILRQAQDDNHSVMEPCHSELVELLSNHTYKKIISKVFSIMHKINNNPAVSRIENIDESLQEVFLSMGYNLNTGESEYVYLREDLVTLKGNLYKSKRAMYNYFIKNYQYRYEAFQTAHAEECMRLFEQWKMNRGKKLNDDLYYARALLEDASYSHKQAITNYEALSLTGRVVLINKRIEGYTFGFSRGDVFYILMEITNPDIKGLSQFIFREFCREAVGCMFINTLGDSGLVTLRNVKLSYRPCKIVPSFVVYDKR